ncbi:LuxR C-terminal-related transcriptional regulator [Hyalangium gracile]|uniref:LuxR C-terminal-related transcriptional regulator n=1 Tax=Hyalangium gracile TaxID=394092 RepID=UPI001CC9E23C|nr:LuxR C-terminal-related transcriptional regulator [Hyalangium gracile]
MLSHLSTEDRTRIASADPGGWYDVRLLERVMNAISQQLQADDALLTEIGRFDADRELSGVHRWYLRLMRPSFAIRHMNMYWRRSHDTGTWSSTQNGGQVSAELRDWVIVNRTLCMTVMGYLGRTLELFGGKISHLEHPECRALGAPACVFRTQLELPADEPRPGRRPTREDVSAVAHELAQYPDREALAEALVSLLRFQFGCGWVELWSTGPDGQMQLQGVSGERGLGTQRRFVLEVGGRNVGRLEVQLPVGPGQESVDEVINELVPWFAIALEVARSSRNAPPVLEEDELARRLRRAKETAQLTPRQIEVLELVARGKTNKEIAAVLGRSEGTVEVHVTNLLRKYGASNRAGLVALFWGKL